MDTQTAIDIIKALDTIGTALDMEPNSVGAFACFYDEKKIAIINEAAKLYNEFHGADIVERGRLIGLEITQCDGGYQTSTVLSE